MINSRIAVMRLQLSKLFGSFLIITFLTSCSPSVLDVTLYTTDIEAANEGEVFEVPVRASFTMYSDDDGELDTATLIAEKYLAPESVFSQSSTDYSETLVIETTIPIGTLENLETYLGNNNRVAVLVLENTGELEVSLKSTDYADALNSELSDVNFMLGFELPGDATNFRVISDLESLGKASALSPTPSLSLSEFSFASLGNASPELL